MMDFKTIAEPPKRTYSTFSQYEIFNFFLIYGLFLPFFGSGFLEDPQTQQNLDPEQCPPSPKKRSQIDRYLAGEYLLVNTVPPQALKRAHI